ncbi:MAG: hypothetical protein GYB31_06225 [Bacteroidetes bacterium]|nr:hypothetical protein [Bacteroidota bacterium]
MKALKVILGIIGVLIAVYLVLCLVGPKEVDASQSTEIEAPASVVYEQVADVTKWKNWGPWQLKDTTMEITYGEKTEGEGASYSWTSENSGIGNLEITEANAPNSISTRLNFGMENNYGYGKWEFEESEGTTNATWSMTSDPNPFFFRGMAALMGMNKRLEKDFAAGLANIKKIAEEQAANMPTTYNGLEVKSMDHPGGVFAGVRETVEMDKMSDFIGQAYGTVMGAMAEKQVPMAGPASCLYYTWDEETQTSDMVAAIPIGEVADLGENVEVIEIPAGKAAMIDYYGAYEGLGSAHEAMDAYLKANGHAFKAPCLEMYVTDPTTESDTTKWLTQVVYFYE